MTNKRLQFEFQVTTFKMVAGIAIIVAGVGGCVATQSKNIEPEPRQIGEYELYLKEHRDAVSSVIDKVDSLTGGEAVSIMMASTPAPPKGSIAPMSNLKTFIVYGAEKTSIPQQKKVDKPINTEGDTPAVEKTAEKVRTIWPGTTKK
jgi:hypothetical protein